MQMKLIQTLRAGQTEAVVQTRFGTRIFEVGKTVDVPDEEASLILSSPTGSLFHRTQATPSEAKAVVHAARSTVAAGEETKMVSQKDLKTKQ